MVRFIECLRGLRAESHVWSYVCTCNLSGFPTSACSLHIVTVRVVIRIVLLITTACHAMPGRSELSTSADLPGLRDPFLDVLQKFLWPLQGLETKSVT